LIQQQDECQRPVSCLCQTIQGTRRGGTALPGELHPAFAVEASVGAEPLAPPQGSPLGIIAAKPERGEPVGDIRRISARR
jgi:hypothetical protein